MGAVKRACVTDITPAHAARIMRSREGTVVGESGIAGSVAIYTRPHFPYTHPHFPLSVTGRN